MVYDHRYMPETKQMTKKIPYSFWVGTWKVIKNGAIFILPSLVAYQASVPQKYAVLLSCAIYYIKNYLENK